MPCAAGPITGGATTSSAEAPHEGLRAMVSSGYLESVGFDYEPPQLGDVFSSPDSIRKSVAQR